MIDSLLALLLYILLMTFFYLFVRLRRPFSLNSIPLHMFLSSDSLIFGCFCFTVLKCFIFIKFKCGFSGYSSFWLVVNINAGLEMHYFMLSLILGCLMKELMLFWYFSFFFMRVDIFILQLLILGLFWILDNLAIKCYVEILICTCQFVISNASCVWMSTFSGFEEFSLRILLNRISMACMFI